MTLNYLEIGTLLNGTKSVRKKNGKKCKWTKKSWISYLGPPMAYLSFSLFLRYFTTL